MNAPGNENTMTDLPAKTSSDVRSTQSWSLRDSGIEFEELVLNRDYTDRTLRAISNVTTYPQVFINAEHVGGADELEAWLGDQQQAAA